jgi:hypothetical protein
MGPPSCPLRVRAVGEQGRVIALPQNRGCQMLVGFAQRVVGGGGQLTGQSPEGAVRATGTTQPAIVAIWASDNFAP